LSITGVPGLAAGSGGFSFGFVPAKPWFDADNDDEEGDRDDNESESTAWQENAIRAMERD
jgi:hypothetical protein